MNKLVSCVLRRQISIRYSLDNFTYIEYYFNFSFSDLDSKLSLTKTQKYLCVWAKRYPSLNEVPDLVAYVSIIYFI